MRPVWPDLEDNPRYVGDHRGDTYLPGVSVPPDTPPTEPIGFIDQVDAHVRVREGDYGIMNEHQLAIGESTCSGRFVASAAAPAVRLSSASTSSRASPWSVARRLDARFGSWATLPSSTGFYGAAGFEGGSETLLIADTEEGWVMHFVPYPETNSAVWVAQRVPDDEVAVVMNMFVIREVNSTGGRGASSPRTT